MKIKMSIKEQVIRRLKNHTLEEVAESRSFSELNLDSLDKLEAMMGFEDDFGIEITDSEIIKLKTVKDLIIFIKKRTP